LLPPASSLAPEAANGARCLVTAPADGEGEADAPPARAGTTRGVAGARRSTSLPGPAGARTAPTDGLGEADAPPAGVRTAGAASGARQWTSLPGPAGARTAPADGLGRADALPAGARAAEDASGARRPASGSCGTHCLPDAMTALGPGRGPPWGVKSGDVRTSPGLWTALGRQVRGCRDIPRLVDRPGQ